MGELEKQHHDNVASLEPEERSDRAFEAFRLHAAGWTYKDISAKVNLARSAVKKLIREQAAVATKHAPDSRAVATQTYRDLLLWAWGILNDHGNNPRAHSPLIVSKAAEIAMQSRVRMDKLQGVEAPKVNLHTELQTAKDMIEQQVQEGSDNLSPVELGNTFNEDELSVEYDDDEYEDEDDFTESF